MSAYKIIKAQISKRSHAVRGLIALGVPENLIEIHDSAQNLIGYEGGQRGQKGHVIVRKEHVNHYLSHGCSNDIGVEFVDGECKLHISDYDVRWWDQVKGKFFQYCALAKVEEQAEAMGYSINVEEVGDEINVELISSY